MPRNDNYNDEVISPWLHKETPNMSSYTYELHVSTCTYYQLTCYIHEIYNPN